jgi:hypothetical protein
LNLGRIGSTSQTDLSGGGVKLEWISSGNTCWVNLDHLSFDFCGQSIIYIDNTTRSDTANLAVLNITNMRFEGDTPGNDTNGNLYAVRHAPRTAGSGGLLQTIVINGIGGNTVGGGGALFYEDNNAGRKASVVINGAASNHDRLYDSAGMGLQYPYPSSRNVSAHFAISEDQPPTLHGTGAPSLAAPDGTRYIRTDGGAGTTLYVRESGSWSGTS